MFVARRLISCLIVSIIEPLTRKLTRLFPQQFESQILKFYMAFLVNYTYYIYLQNKIKLYLRGG